jgi:hypothetical protein
MRKIRRCFSEKWHKAEFALEEPDHPLEVWHAMRDIGKVNQKICISSTPKAEGRGEVFYWRFRFCRLFEGFPGDLGSAFPRSEFA